MLTVDKPRERKINEPRWSKYGSRRYQGAAMKRNWMPEPWELGGCSGRMLKTPHGDGFAADFDTLENAKRAVSCVNALAGVKNPKKFMQVVRRYWSEGELCNEDSCCHEYLRAALKSFEVKP